MNAANSSSFLASIGPFALDVDAYDAQEGSNERRYLVFSKLPWRA